MPSSFTRVLSSALGFSPCPPVSVCGTVPFELKLRGFSWKHGISRFAAHGHSSSRLSVDPPDLPKGSAYTLKPGRPTPGRPNLLRPPIAFKRGIGILTDFPSTTPFGLALGADSPCADERCAGNLGLSARELFTPFIATHVSIRTSDTSSIPHRTPSQAYRTLSYHPGIRGQESGSSKSLFHAFTKTLQHSGYLLVFVTPDLPFLLLDISKIKTVPQPDTHFICRAHAHTDEPPEFRFRLALFTKAFRQVRTNRLARPANLIRQAILLDFRLA